MADNPIRIYKSASRSRVRKKSPSTSPSSTPRGTLIASTGVHRHRQVESIESYTEFKATIASAVEEMKLEMQEQHALTRAEVKIAKRDILEAVRESPVAFVKLICECTALFMLFALAVRFLLKIELVNPVFALFSFAALAVYWGMAWVQQRSDKRNSESPTS